MFDKIEAFTLTWNRRAATYLGGGCIILCMLVLIADATSRTLFNRPFEGGIDIVELILAWIVFPSFAYALIVGSHVRMTLGLMRFPPKLRRWCEVFTNLCGTIFFLWATIYAVPYFWISWLVKEVPMGPTPVPMWLGKFVMIAGMFMIFTVYLLRLIRLLQPSRAKEEVRKGEKVLVSY